MKKPVGTITRGTTNPNRLRRIDRWMMWRYQSLIRHADQPLIVDLGFGAQPTTTHELWQRMRTLNNDLDVIGLEIDPERVRLAQATATKQVTFALGGFEIPTTRVPLVIRALNVLRQYEESAVPRAWALMQERLLPDGFVVEGTCDEPGRLASWVELSRENPLSLTLAASAQHLSAISDIAPRLPKVLIHHNVRGNPIHRLFQDADRAWAAHSGLRIFGARQRWAATIRSLRSDWPVLTPPSRERDGEITIDWKALSR